MHMLILSSCSPHAYIDLTLIFMLCLCLSHAHVYSILMFIVSPCSPMFTLSSCSLHPYAFLCSPIFMLTLSSCSPYLLVYPISMSILFIFIVSQYLSHPHIYFIPSLCLSHPYIHPSFIFIPSAPLLHPHIHVHLISSALLSHSHSSPSYDHLSPISIPSNPHSISFPCSS